MEEDLGRSTIHNVPKPWVFGPNFLGRLTQTIAVLNMTPQGSLSDDEIRLAPLLVHPGRAP
jgi:hypothetical protein